MAKVPIYDAPDRLLHTEEKGFAAFETAGRRIGPAYDRAATDVRDIGNTTAGIYKERLWPWDILSIEQNAGSGSGSRNSRGGGGGGFKTQGFQSDPFGQFAESGRIGRLGNVAAMMAEDLTRGTPTNRSGKGKLVSPTGVDDPNNKHLSTPDQDPRQSRIIDDPRKQQPINFPDKVGDQNSTVIPRFANEQPGNSDSLQREAERGVFREEIGAPPGYSEDGGNYGGGSDAQPAPSTSFGSRVWNGLNDAADWIGRNAPGSDSPSAPYYGSPDAAPAPAPEDN